MSTRCVTYLQLRAQVWVLICVNFYNPDVIPKLIIDLQEKLLSQQEQIKACRR